MSTARIAPRRRLAVALVLAASLAAATATPAEAAGGRAGGGLSRLFDYELTLLHNSDGESQLLGASGQPDYGGIARFATVVDQQRDAALARDPNGPLIQRRGVLLVSSGDNFLAGPEFNASLEKGVPYYDAIALDEIGYDSFTLGNHDFDFGPDITADFIESFESDVPFLSANLDVSAEPRLAALEAEGRIASSVVIRERGRRIGVIGLTTPDLPSISSPRGVEVFDELAKIVQGEVDDLTAEGANIIILSSHLQGIGEELGLVPQLSDVDIVVAGGGGELLAETGTPLAPGDTVVGAYPAEAVDADGTLVPVVATTGDYKYVGRLVTTFDRHGNLTGIDDSSGPVRVSGVGPDAVAPNPTIQAEVVEPVAASVAALAAEVIGASEVDLDGTRTAVRTTETNLGSLVADSLLVRATALAPEFGAPAPDVSLQNGGGIRNDAVIPAGPITELDTFDVLPFSNFVSVVPEVPRAQFKEIMENAVAGVENTSGAFAQISGFSFTYDPAGLAQVLDAEGNVVTAGTRVLDVALDDGTVLVAGGAVIDGPAINVATIDFSARGGDGYPFRGLPFATLGDSYQQALSDYISEDLGGVITADDYPEGGEGRITP